MILGTKIYYSKVTGNILYIRYDNNSHYIRETTFDEDYEQLVSLKDYQKDLIGSIQFEYGEYHKLSKNSTGVSVNIETKELIFTYDSLPEIPQEPSKIEILEDKISILEEENKKLKEVTKEQDNLLVDNAYKITMLEMNLGGK